MKGLVGKEERGWGAVGGKGLTGKRDRREMRKRQGRKGIGNRCSGRGGVGVLGGGEGAGKGWGLGNATLVLRGDACCSGVQ